MKRKNVTMFIIFLIVISLIFLSVIEIKYLKEIITAINDENPESITNVKDMINLVIGQLTFGKILPFSDAYGVKKEISKEKEDSSIINCLNKVTELIKATNEKPASCGATKFNKSFINLSVIEYKKFTNTQEAMYYLGKYSEVYPDLFDTKENKIIEHNDIVAVLTRFDIGYPNKKVNVSLPMICINGTLTGHSEERLIYPVSCLNMPTAVPSE